MELKKNKVTEFRKPGCFQTLISANLIYRNLGKPKCFENV